MSDQKPKPQEGQKSQGLPEQVKDSPYTQYKDIEDYKEKGYGTHGHQQVQPGRGAAASTDAPTSVVGGAVASTTDANDADTITDTINQHGIC
ncbi:Late embryogenesis abundant protein, LEA-18 [Artemisia annua]|uniref:Late embryogenesis abundant protein, LEA-18 n=1 Tax=Artemisia annua TaxID=35608 RepID=A0A2U1LG23_ARTAN|nr:Late embryogenesis abundant protein, LEA-18 [Artemisia annua]